MLCAKFGCSSWPCGSGEEMKMWKVYNNNAISKMLYVLNTFFLNGYNFFYKSNHAYVFLNRHTDKIIGSIKSLSRPLEGRYGNIWESLKTHYKNVYIIIQGPLYFKNLTSQHIYLTSDSREFNYSCINNSMQPYSFEVRYWGRISSL